MTTKRSKYRRKLHRWAKRQRPEGISWEFSRELKQKVMRLTGEYMKWWHSA